MSMFTEAASGKPVPFDLRGVVLAGYTGRDQESVKRHIEELAEHGVPGPERVPTFYSATPNLVMAADSIDVLGSESSGEAEFILFYADGGLYVGAGSDHTDRALERDSITHAKQLCPKVVSSRVWRYADVKPHWDQVTLRSFAGDERTLYQEGPAAEMLDPQDILARVEKRTGRGLDGVLVFSGTLPLVGELAYADRFEVELRDETSGESLSLQYRVNVTKRLD
jgi:uncharacterized protein DUF2848